ncbi:MAG: hypothetical protein ACNI22_09710 [Halarcobacter sp.]
MKKQISLQILNENSNDGLYASIKYLNDVEFKSFEDKRYQAPLLKNR